MHPLLLIILTALILDYLLDLFANLVNLNHLQPKPPELLKDIYPKKEYARSQVYLRQTTHFSLIQSTLTLILTLGFILVGGFGYFDALAQNLTSNSYLAGIIFSSSLLILTTLLSLPFSVYSTFVLEAKFGFNQSNLSTFVSDTIKTILISLVLVNAILVLIMWLFNLLGPFAWLAAWISVSLIQLFLVFIAPLVFLPLFNRFSPLPSGKLRSQIQAYAKAQGYRLEGIYTMDGSRRSTKANAFFIGFGPLKRVVLFDTLIKNHPPSQLVAILAHEIGHHRLGHILHRLILSLIVTFLLFFLLDQLLGFSPLFTAFSLRPSLYTGILLALFLFSPINRLLSLFTNAFSRHHEYQADHFSISTYPKPQALAKALKTLSASNLTNLTPHPLKVILDYSHPPLVNRLQALGQTSSKPKHHS